MVRVFAFEYRDGSPFKAWRLNVTPRWAQQYDNGHLFSVGLEVPNDVSPRVLAGLLRTGRAVECPIQEWANDRVPW